MPKKAAHLSSVSTQSIRPAAFAVENCESCKAWLKREQGDGFCRFNPPQLVAQDGGARYQSCFPIMTATGWCAQWKAS